MAEPDLDFDLDLSRRLKLDLQIPEPDLDRDLDLSWSLNLDLVEPHLLLKNRRLPSLEHLSMLTGDRDAESDLGRPLGGDCRGRSRVLLLLLGLLDLGLISEGL